MLYVGELCDGDIVCLLLLEMMMLLEDLFALRVARAKERAFASDDAGVGGGLIVVLYVYIFCLFGLLMYKM